MIVTCPRCGETRHVFTNEFGVHQCKSCTHIWAPSEGYRRPPRDKLTLEEACDRLASLYQLSSRRVHDHIYQIINFDRSSGQLIVYSCDEKVGPLTDQWREYLIGRAQSGFSVELVPGPVSSRIHIGLPRVDKRCSSGRLPLVYCPLRADLSGTFVRLKSDMEPDVRASKAYDKEG